MSWCTRYEPWLHLAHGGRGNNNFIVLARLLSGTEDDTLCPGTCPGCPLCTVYVVAATMVVYVLQQLVCACVCVQQQ